MTHAIPTILKLIRVGADGTPTQESCGQDLHMFSTNGTVDMRSIILDILFIDSEYLLQVLANDAPIKLSCCACR